MDEYEEQLVKAGVPAQPVLRLALFKAQLQAMGEFDLEIDEWDRKTATSKTFANFRPYNTPCTTRTPRLQPLALQTLPPARK